MEDCKVDAHDGWAGIWGLPARGMGAANIEVIGGDYGVYDHGNNAGSVIVGAG